MRQKELKGIGGWLGLYVYMGLVVLPIIILFMVITLFGKNKLPSSAQSSLPWYVIVLGIVLYSMDFYAKIRILLLKKGAIRLMKKVLLALIGFMILETPFTYSKIIESNGVAGMFSTVWGILGTFIWYLYFVNSERVKNSFPEN